MVAAIGVPVLVAALSMQPPVHVAACEISDPSPAFNIGSDGAATQTSEPTLHLRFSNEGTAPIKRIVFTLNDGTKVIDAGTFAPGVTIDHSFDIMQPDADSCSVTSATFADGEMWSAPDEPQTTARALGQSKR